MHSYAPSKGQRPGRGRPAPWTRKANALAPNTSKALLYLSFEIIHSLTRYYFKINLLYYFPISTASDMMQAGALAFAAQFSAVLTITARKPYFRELCVIFTCDVGE